MPLALRILFLNTDYRTFLAWLYRQRPALALASYEEQASERDNSLFGTADFMSRQLVAHGHAAIDIHANNRPLQEAWAAAHSRRTIMAWSWRLAACVAPGRVRRRLVSLDTGSTRFEAILAAQIADFRPTVLYNHDPSEISADRLKALLPQGCALVGQIASPRAPGINWRAYDLMISSLPNFVAAFRREGIAAEYLPLAFEPRVLERVRTVQRDVAVSFVGSLSPAHVERLGFLEWIARHRRIDVWGDGIERLAADSPLRACHRGQAWGPDMFAVLGRSWLTLNKHIDVSENYANNMRLFEATGMGACLVTDWKENLGELFEPDKEVVAYRSVDECLDRLRYFEAHENERARIAAAGQARCLIEHSYARRMEQLTDILTRRFA